jgi:tripartite ATP-independent transporter DctM subunit
MTVVVIMFFAMMLIGIPVAFAFGLSAIVGLLVFQNVPLVILPQRMFAGVDSFPFLAIPFFILVGDLMGSSGVTLALVQFCNTLVGRIRGGLAHVNALASVLFAGISGAATADAAALGSVLIPAMTKAGYDKPFSAAVTAATAVVGPIIPPSIGLVIYSLALGGQVSIGGLFLAGILPGFLIAAAVMMLCYVMAVRRNYPVSQERFSPVRTASAFASAAPALFAPVIILGGILGGVFTPTESAAVAVVYVMVIGFASRRLTAREVGKAIESSMSTTAVVTLLLATSGVATWLMAVMHLPEAATQLVMSISPDRISFTIFFLLFMILVGMLIEPVALMVMFAPIFAPIAYQFGFEPLHFGLVFVLAVEIGLITPPVGVVLFIICGISGVSLKTLSRAIVPFVVVEIVVLILVAFVPDIALWIPRSLGYH